MRRAFLLVATLALGTQMGCGGEDAGGPSSPLPPPAPGEGFQLAMTATAPAGTEIWRCVVGQLPTEVFENVGRVESVQSEGMHHMDVMTTAFANVDLEPGEYDCAEIYDRFPQLMEDGLIIYAAQAARQEIDLPEGVVANLPPRLPILHEIHYVNTSDQDVEVYSLVNAYTVHPSEVRETIWGQVVRDTHLQIPAASEHSEWTRCVMNEPIDVILMASHTHELGQRVTVRLFDGDTVGPVVYENTDWETPRLESYTASPLHLAAGQGVEFTCDFKNSRSTDVSWGFTAQDEMCQIALVYTPGEATRTCEIVDASN